MNSLRVEDFDYELPEELIAQSPLDKRDDSRLLVVNPREFVEETAQVSDTLPSAVCRHGVFRDLPKFLNPGDVLVVNNSRVIPARLYGTKSGTGAHIELLLTQAVSEFEWIGLAKPAKRLKEGAIIEFRSQGDSDQEDSAPVVGKAEVVEVHDGGLRKVRFIIEQDMESFLDRVGSMPLPPYIHEPLQNASRYQTVYSEPLGSVAAPTAGLHFTPELLEAVAAKGVEVQSVTLHVGIGTFRPVSVETVEQHVMHKEWYEVSETTAAAVNQARREGRRVIAVGTTALRTLESATEAGTTRPGRRETGIFIYPGYRFQAVDALITNFHLPRSTLLMLVSAFMGHDLTLRTYALAVAQRYRFFSFGDAMFITHRGGVL